MPTMRPEVIPEQNPNEPILALASDVPSRDMSAFGFAIPTVPPIQRIKRKASNVELAGLSQCAPPTGPRIKLEPSSPTHFDRRENNTGDNHLELYGSVKGHSSSSRAHDMEDQMLDIQVDGGSITVGSSRTPLAAEVRLDKSSRDVQVPGLLRPSPTHDNFPHSRRQKASRKRENLRPYTRKIWEDLDYNSIPDYAPPISTLASGNPHILRVEWRGRILVDLSMDPDQHMLDEVEIKLATSLNLSCAKYLCTKRRIFQARLEALRAGREFKKTDAQRASKISHSKAIVLFGAFEKVGWFDKKYFLDYLRGRETLSKKANMENEGRVSVFPRPTESDIWDVNESEPHFTSEGDEESTDDDTADSSVSSDGRNDEMEGWTHFDSYRDNSLRKQHCGLSLIEGDGSQRGVLNDRALQTDNTVSGDENIDEGFMLENRKSKRAVILKEIAYPRISDSPSGRDTEQAPMLKTRSMMQKIKFAHDSEHGLKSDRSSIIEPEHGQRKSSSEQVQRRAAPANLFTAQNPLPHSLDEANAADIMLVEMKKKGRPWLEIEGAWEMKTGKAQDKGTLSSRYRGIMANNASTRLESVKMRDGHRALACPLLEADDMRDKGSITCSTLSSIQRGQLFAAEAEIEKNFQREKAELVAEIEANFRSEKWNLVAKAMSRMASACYSAESIQTHFEGLARDPKRADAGEEEDPATFSSLPRRTTCVVRKTKSPASTPLRSDVKGHNKASNAPNQPHSQFPDNKSQATTITRGKRSAHRSHECEKCGREYRSPAGLICHREKNQNCGFPAPRSPKSRQKKSNRYSSPEHAQPRAEGQNQFPSPPATQISCSNLVPRQTHTNPLQADRVYKTPALKGISSGPFAEETARRRQEVQDKSQSPTKQSARSLRAWAIRRALGTTGRRGGPPRASTIAKRQRALVRDATAKAGIPLAPTITRQSDPKGPSSNETAPIVIEKEVRYDANQHQQSLVQIILSAPQTDSGQKRIKTLGKHVAQRHRCKKCGMSYAHRADHYRVVPNAGSEHRRRMAANNAAKRSHSCPTITDARVESTSDTLMGQMIFEQGLCG